ncbi:acyltransferase [Parabacteroides sp. BX2]|uniref:Acyltransferase n=1 Tax=Parabacteroides segnis TaxID=2763058 RepID=A0ABR7E1P5_9BACT|nr:acyltransferase [Parabacteroides segnis]MBC5643679.1 acyltransferase [Parabacteroides segnis]
MKHKSLLLYSWFVRTLLYFLPDIPFIMRFRGWLYSLGMASCGKNFQVTHSAILNGLDNMFVGKDVYIANFGNFICNDPIYIGDGVLFGPSVVMSSGNHVFDGIDFRSKVHREKISIGDGCWIAAHVTIISGSVIPSKSLIAAGALVTKKSCCGESCGVFGGVPAKFIRKHYDA